MEEKVVAKRVKKREFAGTGCVIQGLGLLAPFVLGALLGAFGILIGLVMLVVLFFLGSAKSSHWTCGNCRNPLADKSIRVCPTCKAELE